MLFELSDNGCNWMSTLGLFSLAAAVNLSSCRPCNRAGVAWGATFAAAALLLTSAVLTPLVGAFALTVNDLVLAGPAYAYTFKITGWGSVNMLTGMVLAVVADAFLSSATWARAAAIIVTCLAIVVTFVWIPYYAVRSVVLIALDAVVIWGVATWSTSRKYEAATAKGDRHGMHCVPT